MGKTALVVGATGAVGRETLRGLCESENYDKIIVWARRELNFSHEKLETQIINFDEIKDIRPREVDEIFCALGTTMKQAGSRGQFYRVDVSYRAGLRELTNRAATCDKKRARAGAYGRAFYDLAVWAFAKIYLNELPPDERERYRGCRHRRSADGC